METKMKKYQPINNQETLQIIQNNEEMTAQQKVKKFYKDPKGQIPPAAYKIIKNEKLIKDIGIGFWFILTTLMIIAFTLVAAQIAPFQNHLYVGWLISFGLIALIALFLGTKNLIDSIRWKNTIANLRDSITLGDYSWLNNFQIAYKKLVLKNTNLNWILIFILTYVGIFTAITLGLYNGGDWVIGKPDAQSVIYLNLTWTKWMDNVFGNTRIFCYISFSALGLLIILYASIKLFDKKRIEDLENILGEKFIEISDKVQELKKERNKIWFRSYIVIVSLTILIPVALILYAFWRGLIKRKKNLVK
ncbi:hypothetical protein MGALLINA_03720 [Mycoplasmopsis gallinarum]|uniref:Uncharacterized protein n=2 Tax=Mycoplasmopsis gallinarum TaxID=29557 RepID=A0A168RE42_9BACT|nr:hypothetical protein MGALLINA_03720 [Mycoplasmopsis gallinarum]